MSIADELQKLADLHDEGLLSSREFAEAKRKLLDSPVNASLRPAPEPKPKTESLGSGLLPEPKPKPETETKPEHTAQLNQLRSRPLSIVAGLFGGFTSWCVGDGAVQSMFVVIWMNTGFPEHATEIAMYSRVITLPVTLYFGFRATYNLVRYGNLLGKSA